MDYFGIIKKAYEITIRHKFLWIFGILAGGFGGFKGFTTSYSGGGSQWQNTFNQIDTAKLEQFWIIWGGLILFIILIFLIFGLVFFILSIISQAALVGAAEKLNRSEKANFKIGFGIGWHNFWRVFGMGLIYFLMVLGSLAVLIVPVVVMFVEKLYIIAVIWGLLFFFVDLVFWILIGLISPYSLRVVVLQKFGVWQSIRESLHFFRDHWVNVVLMYLILFAISFGFGIVLVLAILLAGAILVAIGIALYLASSVASIIYGVIVGLAFLAVIVIITGVFNAFYSTFITLTYLELAKKT